jgi:hypothetical protein
MTVIGRRVASVPVRTASETWDAICELLTAAGDPARADLRRAADLVSMLIAEEYTSTAPIVVSGAGPQIRIYTLHGDDAIGADDDVTPVRGYLTRGKWEVSLPAGEIDLEYAMNAVAQLPRIRVRELSSALPTTGAAAGAGVTIDAEALAKL